MGVGSTVHYSALGLGLTVRYGALGLGLTAPRLNTVHRRQDDPQGLAPSVGAPLWGVESRLICSYMVIIHVGDHLQAEMGLWLTRSLSYYHIWTYKASILLPSMDSPTVSGVGLPQCHRKTSQAHPVRRLGANKGGYSALQCVGVGVNRTCA